MPLIGHEHRCYSEPAEEEEIQAHGTKILRAKAVENKVKKVSEWCLTANPANDCDCFQDSSGERLSTHAHTCVEKLYIGVMLRDIQR